MPFEVFTIKQPESTLDHSEISRTAEVVASEIKEAYARVADLGGKIVAEHTLAMGGDRCYKTADVNWLFLVAEIPETK